MLDDIDLPDDMLVANCCQCGRLMTFDGRGIKLGLVQMSNSRLGDRPWCIDCIEPLRPTGGTPRGYKDDPGNSWDNVVSALEEDR